MLKIIKLNFAKRQRYQQISFFNDIGNTDGITSKAPLKIVLAMFHIYGFKFKKIKVCNFTAHYCPSYTFKPTLLGASLISRYSAKRNQEQPFPAIKIYITIALISLEKWGKYICIRSRSFLEYPTEVRG